MHLKSTSQKISVYQKTIINHNIKKNFLLITLNKVVVRQIKTYKFYNNLLQAEI